MLLQKSLNPMSRFDSSNGPRRRILFLYGLLFCGSAAGLLWVSGNAFPGFLKETHPAPPALPIISRGAAPVRPALTPKNLGPTVSAARIDSEESWDFTNGGQPLSIALALDEAMLRDAGGKETIVALIPPATQASLPSRLAALAAPGGVFPVAYLTGEARSASSRRLITPDLRVQMDDADSARLTIQHKLVVKNRPAYAPGWVILTARDAFAALDAMVNLRTERGVASADVLLAKQQTRRTLPNDPLAARQWHLKKTTGSVTGSDLNIDSAWNYPAATGSRGTGIRIGVVDDGLQTGHPDLAPNTDTANDRDWNGTSGANGFDDDPSPGSGDDHGTACAGNAAALGNNGIGVTGAAPEATLVGMRLIAASVADDEEAEAMAYLPELIQVKSNSWGPDDTGSILEGPGPLTLAALAHAAATGRGGKGSVILWAGGNGGEVSDNSNYDGYANSLYTLAIGAIDSAGNRASYSEPGSNLVACAPSSGTGGTLGITTVDRTGSLGYNSASTASGGDYTDDFGGTSSATPTAAGVVALLLEKNPNLGWRDVMEILIRTGVKPPASTGWVNNGAGFAFNHDFGAGLIDATAAVNLAASWVSLPAQTSITSPQTGLSVAIPNNNTSGVTRTFNLSASNLRVEKVALTLSATHSARGNLEISLTSPGGMISRLAETHGDSGDNYSNWVFTSVRHWGEISTGTWTVKVADRSSSNNTTDGTLTAATLQIFGSPGTPVNPAPVTVITEPADGQIFSPGTAVTVNVSANDQTLEGTAGIVAKVEFFDSDQLVGTDTSAPFSFIVSPVPGSHALTAKATDSEGTAGTSVSVTITLADQAPVITAAGLSAMGQNFTDTALTVASLTATDPEGAPLTYFYQWESSTDQTVFSEESSATTATAPALSGKLLRCVITASDGLSLSAPFTTAAVNQLTRPDPAAQAGLAYTYASGLVLRGTDSPLSRRAIIHEFSQGPPGGASEWIEILTLQTGSLAYWDLGDAANNLIVFVDDPVWDNIPAGTLIVIYNGAFRDPLLPADDADPTDGRMIVSSTNAAFFDDGFDAWLPLGNSGDAIFLSNDEQVVIHSVAYGNSTAAMPNVGSVGSGKSAYYAGDTDPGAGTASQWRTTTALTARGPAPRIPANLPLSYGGPWSPLPTGFTGTALGSPYSSSLGGDTSTGSAKFDDSNDSLVLEYNASAPVLSYQIKGNPASGTATAGTFLIQESATGSAYTTLRTITNASNADTAYSDTPATATRFVKFLYQTKTLGNIQLDKLALTGGTAGGLTLTVNPATFAENTGSAAATGTVSLPAAPGNSLTVSLASSNTGEATVPASIRIAAGQTISPVFAITAVDDTDSDGPQQVILTASATGYPNGTAALTVTDNEASVEGVTPAAANNAINSGFVTALRTGSRALPALFRVGVGAVIPAGLTLDPATGILSGTPLASNPAGDFPIVIERYNSLGESISQSWTLTLTGSASNTYAAWIGGYPGVGALSGPADDPDRDGLPNSVENHLGTLPTVSNSGLVAVSSPPGRLIFRHSRTNNPAIDLTAGYEWSADLVSWHSSAASAGGLIVTFGTISLTDTSAPELDLIEITAGVTTGTAAKLFARLKVTRP